MNALPHWCQKLRWKGYHADQEDPARVVEVFSGGYVTYTCLSTQNAFGEDDGPVAPERCDGSRECYAAHRNLRLPVVG